MDDTAKFNENDCCSYICLEPFDLVDRIPKKLDCCDKIFCLDCLTKLHMSNKIICPLCRKDNKVSNPKTLNDAYMFCMNCSQIGSFKIFKVRENSEECDYDITCPSCKNYGKEGKSVEEFTT